jgi:hypothetical protein
VPDPITSTSAAGRAGRTVPVTPPGPWLRPRRSRLLLVGLPLFAVFAAFGAIIWLAYEHGTDGPPVGEPPLVRAPAVALKLAPEDDGAAIGEGEEGGEVLDLLSDVPPSDQLERLLPRPEEPLAPAVTGEEMATPEEPADSPSATAELAPPAPDPNAAGAPATPELAAAPPEPPRQAPPPDEQQTAAVAAPEPPASEPLPTPEEAEATLDALLAEVTEETDQARIPPQPAPVQSARTEPVAPRPTPSEEVRPAVAPPAPRPAPQPAPPATVSPFTPPGGEVTPIERDQRLARPATTGPRPVTSEPLIEPAPDRTNVAALGGDYRIQLAAVRGESDARRAWDLFLIDLGPVLSGLQPFIERADTANGVFYRVQVGPFASQQAAESLCDELKQRNASCFVIRR